MTIKQFSFVFLVCLISVSGSGQIAFQKYFLSSPTDVRAQIFETSDSNLIIIRQTIINGIGHLQVIKADQNGDTIWCKADYDTFIKHFFSSSQSADGNIFIGGVNADSITNMRGAIVKIDTSGNALWSKVFSDTIINCITLVQEMNNGDLLIGGMLKDHPYRFNTEGVLMRCDSIGNVIWYTHDFNNPYPHNALENNSGGFIIRGQYYFNYPTYYIASYDSAGNQLWQRPQLGLKNNSPFYYDSDSTIVSVGPENLLRFDSSGASAGTLNYTFGDTTVSIIRTNDSGYLIASVANISFTESKALFTKVDSLFQPQWQKTIANYSMENPTTCFQSRSGRYFFMGNIDSYQHEVRGFSLTGFDTTNITNSIITYPKDSKHCSDFYPNPFQNVTQMALPDEFMNAEVIVTDIFGRHKKTLHASGNKIILDSREMSPGIYFYQVISQGKILCSAKVIVGN